MKAEIEESAGNQEELTLLSQLKRYKKTLKRRATAYEMWLKQDYLKKEGMENDE